MSDCEDGKPCGNVGKCNLPSLARELHHCSCVSRPHGPHCMSSLDEIIGILRPSRLDVETFHKFTKMIPFRSPATRSHFCSPHRSQPSLKGIKFVPPFCRQQPTSKVSKISCMRNCCKQKLIVEGNSPTSISSILRALLPSFRARARGASAVELPAVLETWHFVDESWKREESG